MNYEFLKKSLTEAKERLCKLTKEMNIVKELHCLAYDVKNAALSYYKREIEAAEIRISGINKMIEKEGEESA